MKFYRGYGASEARIERPEEIHELQWFTMDDAMKQFTHDESRRVLKEMLL